MKKQKRKEKGNLKKAKQIMKTKERGRLTTKKIRQRL